MFDALGIGQPPGGEFDIWLVDSGLVGLPLGDGLAERPSSGRAFRGEWNRYSEASSCGERRWGILIGSNATIVLLGAAESGAV